MIKRIVKFIITWFRIPKGMYCYREKRVNVTPRYFKKYWWYPSYAAKHIPCPYWRKIEDRPIQENGWCDYLGKGDTEIKAEGNWVIAYVSPDSDPDIKVGMK